MSIDEVMEQYRQELIQKCDLGARGGEKEKVRVINMWLTNQCNIRCVMCPFISAEYPNKTYYNEEPFFASLKDVKKILPKKKWFDKEGRESGEAIEFNFFKGETFLNPNTMEICRYIKRVYKNSRIAILSNGTIPPQSEEMVKYIDVLGFSLDGGTKQVFESIRVPADFEHVLNTIRSWVRARNKYHPKLLLRTSTTLSTMNFLDLPNIVEAVGKIAQEEGGGWDSVYCQPVVIEDYQDPRLRKITLEYVDKEQGKESLKAAKRIADKYHIRMDVPQSIYEMFEDTSIKEQAGEANDFPHKEVFCDKLRNGYLSYDQSGRVGFACCFMDKKYWRELIERYQIPDNKAPEIIYNCEGYWRLRKDLLEGKLRRECRNCTIGQSEYYRLYEKFGRERDSLL